MVALLVLVLTLHVDTTVLSAARLPWPVKAHAKSRGIGLDGMSIPSYAMDRQNACQIELRPSTAFRSVFRALVVWIAQLGVLIYDRCSFAVLVPRDDAESCPDPLSSMDAESNLSLAEPSIAIISFNLCLLARRARCLFEVCSNSS